MLEIIIDMLLLIGISACWVWIGRVPFDEEKFRIEQEFHGSQSHKHSTNRDDHE